MTQHLKKNNSDEQSKRVNGKANPQAQIRADEKASEVEAKAKSKSCAGRLYRAINMPDNINGIGVTKTRSANGLLQVLLPRPLKAKVVATSWNQRMKRKSPRKSKASEVQQLEIT